MKLGVFQHGWWQGACEALGRAVLPLAVARPADGNPYAAGLDSRAANGTQVCERARYGTADYLIDIGGTGLGFVPGKGDGRNFRLAHEVIGAPLCSHFIDPLSTSFQGLSWEILWQCLQSPTWIKAVWDRAQAIELQRFGVPNVLHLPMAAPDAEYDTDPFDPEQCEPVVSFVGGQNTNYFAANVTVPTQNLLPGIIAQAVRTGRSPAAFLDVYDNLYKWGPLPDPTEPIEQQARKTAAYFQAKLFHHANLCIRNRDRFVIFLKRKLGDTFRLFGRGWDVAYGLSAEAPFPTFDAYLDHFRRTAVNVNLVNGNAETGLNMRHFEITAAGGFMLCHQQPELTESFVPEKECAVFEDEKDLLEKIRYYLAHPQERAAVARAGQQRTLCEHLYSHRLSRLLDMVQTNLTSPLSLASC